ncbi:MAG TPA: DHA2 family efflux MFS transporter permease subunit [Ignavibacteriaceae bacterium]|nr:DHA2 family efflux MFS transporter permease subunit [Ignavibacteriaceae bacterium]
MLNFFNIYLRQNITNMFPSMKPGHKAYSWWVLWSVMIGTFMAVLDVTIVNVALPKIIASFGTSIDKAEWVLTGYLLVFAVMLPSSGWIADHLGYKRTYFLGLLFFTIGSFLCSLSWDENSLIFFRLVQALGAGLIMPVGMAITTREFPPEKRGMALGFWGIAAAASISLGPMIGGYLVDRYSWGAIFDVNVPVGIIGLISVYIIQREYKTEHIRSFDFLGLISMTLFLTSLLLAFADGNASWNTGGWTSNFIVTCFTISAISFIVFIITEFSVKHPLIELRLLKNRNFFIATMMMFIFGAALFGNSFLLPLYLQNSLNYTALQAGMVFFPVGIIQAFMSPIAGRLSDKANPKIPVFIGIVLLTLSMYYSSTFSEYSMHGQIMLPLYLRGFALGFIFIPLTNIALLDIPRNELAQASGLFNTIRQIGGSFGVAILGTILTQRVIYHTSAFSEAANQYSAQFKHITYGVQEFVKHNTGSTGSEMLLRTKALVAQHLVNQAFIEGINDDFLIGALLTAILIIPIFLISTKNKKKNKENIEILE